MPFEVWYFVAIIAVCLVWFVIVRRPMYEALAISFIVCLAISGTWSETIAFMVDGASQSILYTILCFLIFAQILKETGVISKIVNIIIALVGRLSGGAGIVCLAASTFMAFVAGTGPGNVTATGSITIPLMKRAGYKPEFAASVGAACGGLGPIVPPSSSIAVSFACLVSAAGEGAYTSSQLWTVSYGIALWFILHRFIQIMIMCKIYKVKPLDKSELPDLKTAWKEGWSACMLILVVMVPFLIDNTCDALLVRLLGETARGNLSSALLAMTPAYAGAYALIVGRKSFKVSAKNLGNMVQKTVKSLAPMAMLLWMAYSIGALLDYIDCGTPICEWIMSFNLSYFGATIFIIVLVLILTMSLSPNAVMPLFGPMIITIFMNYGVNPLIPAAMLIPLFHGLGQVTIPYATVLYPAMGLAGSDFGKSVVQMAWWVLGHCIVCALLLLGILPVLFM